MAFLNAPSLPAFTSGLLCALLSARREHEMREH
jgi:hypothetical protein